MRLIIAGGRDFNDMAVLLAAVRESKFYRLGITEVVSGACRVNPNTPYKIASGADGLGELWAVARGIPIKRFYAEEHGAWPSCGPRRNEAMAKYGQLLIALPGGKGTRSMIEQAIAYDLLIHEVKA